MHFVTTDWGTRKIHRAVPGAHRTSSHGTAGIPAHAMRHLDSLWSLHPQSCTEFLFPNRSRTHTSVLARRGVHGALWSIQSRGSASDAPPLLGWSSPRTERAVLVSDESRARFIIFLRGSRGASAACAAQVKNSLKVVCRAHQSRPGPPTDRNRCAFPHGKARSGCAASLPPPLWAPRCAVWPDATRRRLPWRRTAAKV